MEPLIWRSMVQGWLFQFIFLSVSLFWLEIVFYKVQPSRAQGLGPRLEILNGDICKLKFTCKATFLSFSFPSTPGYSDTTLETIKSNDLTSFAVEWCFIERFVQLLTREL
jgi:hypothetical protein